MPGPANGIPWREALGDDYEVLAPEHYGSATSGAWTGEHTFTLADDAAKVIALIDASQSKVHLVGHSYGGGVALHVALAPVISENASANRVAPWAPSGSKRGAALADREHGGGAI